MLPSTQAHLFPKLWGSETFSEPCLAKLDPFDPPTSAAPPPSWLTQIGQYAPQKLYCNLAALKNSLIQMHSFLVQDTRYATVTVYVLCLNLQRVRRYKACPVCGELVVRLDTHLKARKHQHLTQAERSYYLVSMKLMHHTSEPCNQARSRKRLV